MIKALYKIVEAIKNVTNVQDQIIWQPWTVAITNLTIGNGTIVGRYCKIGKIVHFKVDVVFGSTTTVGGALTLAFPFPVANYNVGTYAMPIGIARYQDTGTVASLGYIQSTGLFIIIKTDSSFANITSVNATVPHTWANTDELHVQGSYESA